MTTSTTAGGAPPAGIMTGHAPGLDAVRCAAALFVALFHLSWGFAPLANLLPFGWVGVQVFFVVSGVVIANSALRTTPRTFLVNRFLRLYPAAWICTVVGIAAIVVAHGLHATVGVGADLSARRVVSSFLLFGNQFVAPSFWTLPVEIAFYLLVLLCVTLRGGGVLVPLAKGLILWSGAFLGLYAAGRAGFVAVGDLDLGYGLRNVSLLRHGHYFGLGILLLAAARSPGSLAGERLRLVSWIGLAIVLAGIEIGWRADEFARRMDHRVSPAYLSATAFGSWLLLVAFAAASVRPQAPRMGETGRRILRSLGLATYPVYLLHETVGGAVLGALVAAKLPAWPALILSLAALIALSLLVSEVAEPRLRALLRGRPPATSPPEPDRAAAG